LEKDWKKVRKGMKNFETDAHEKEKKIWELDVRV
jgi:hypothetical protein